MTRLGWMILLLFLTISCAGFQEYRIYKWRTNAHESIALAYEAIEDSKRAMRTSLRCSDSIQKYKTMIILQDKRRRMMISNQGRRQ